jgi:hypothetical protein
MKTTTIRLDNLDRNKESKYSKIPLQRCIYCGEFADANSVGKAWEYEEEHRCNCEEAMGEKELRERRDKALREFSIAESNLKEYVNKATNSQLVKDLMYDNEIAGVNRKYNRG